ncbi:hypothetical protein [Polaromonas hydrogenivorans]|uniref:Uncharacterized protein n=1 Tax=Polaromonas hydrogenivorans TaxID=335476 RepID=A0AAU7LWN9_9BURK
MINPDDSGGRSHPWDEQVELVACRDLMERARANLHQVEAVELRFQLLKSLCSILSKSAIQE